MRELARHEVKVRAMPFQTNNRIAVEIGRFLWSVPIANAIASQSWGGPGAMLGAMFSQMGSSGDSIKPGEFKQKATGSATDDPAHWEELGKETFKRVCKMDQLRAKSGMVEERTLNFGLRCNQFASVMIYLLRKNRNVDAPLEIVRMGASRSNCHYIVVIGRDRTTSGAGQVSTNKDHWGREHIMMDPWGAKQRVRHWHDTESGVSATPRGKWFIAPHEFGNEVHSICSWEAPSSQPLTDNVS